MKRQIDNILEDSGIFQEPLYFLLHPHLFASCLFQRVVVEENPKGVIFSCHCGSLPYLVIDTRMQ
jgi:hypothetical protein